MDWHIPTMGLWLRVSVYSAEKGFFTAVFENITDRKRAEHNLAGDDVEFAELYRANPLMMCLINSQRKIERMNQAMAEFAGSVTPPGSPVRLGDRLRCINALNDSLDCGLGRQCQNCALRLTILKTFETGKPCRQTEVTVLAAQGEAAREIRLLVSTASVRIRAERNVLICLEDITARQHPGAPPSEGRKMDALVHLAGDVAHDLNNILAATVLNLHLFHVGDTPGMEPDPTPG